MRSKRARQLRAEARENGVSYRRLKKFYSRGFVNPLQKVKRRTK